MRSPRALLAIAVLVGSVGCARFPWDSSEDFFTRCMASEGIEVSNVEIEIFEDGMSLGYTPVDVQAPGIDTASQRCIDQLQRLYSSNSTTTRPG